MGFWDFINANDKLFNGRLTPASILGGPAVGSLAQGGNPYDAWQAAWGRAPNNEGETGFWGTFGDVGQYVGPAIATMGATGVLSGGAAAAGGAPGGSSAAIPAGGGTAAGGGAFDAGVMATHGGMSNAAGGAGNPAAYAGAPASRSMLTPEQAKMIGSIGGKLLEGGSAQSKPPALLANVGGPTAQAPIGFHPTLPRGFYEQLAAMMSGPQSRR